ncbi:hypothetical protein Cgig2_005114 [Carnegiea gigantea]|nr:hypothetical protein Cgig2_005114 [Carnegiea gigantea]
MDRNLPGKSYSRSASSSSSSSSTSYSNRRYGSNPTGYFGQNPARTHHHRSRLVSEGDRQSGTGSPMVRLEGEDEVKDHSDAHSLVGTCPFMCPVKERSQREQLRDLAVFERLDGNPRKTSSSLAVKKDDPGSPLPVKQESQGNREVCKISVDFLITYLKVEINQFHFLGYKISTVSLDKEAKLINMVLPFILTISTKDVQASDLRPLPVLEDTLNYLMKLLDSSDHPFEIVHDFIFDRTRSIRQDLSMQNIFNDRVIWMYEKMVKFHVISHYKLRRCKGDRSIISSIHHLNKEQLTKCLASLYNLYEVNRSPESVHDNEAEFRSLYVLLHLDSHTQLLVNPSFAFGESLSLWFSHLPPAIIKSKEMNFARRVLR